MKKPYYMPPLTGKQKEEAGAMLRAVESVSGVSPRMIQSARRDEVCTRARFLAVGAFIGSNWTTTASAVAMNYAHHGSTWYAATRFDELLEIGDARFTEQARELALRGVPTRGVRRGFDLEGNAVEWR